MTFDIKAAGNTNTPKRHACSEATMNPLDQAAVKARRRRQSLPSTIITFSHHI